MARKVTEAMKKKIAGKQHFKCANRPGSNTRGLEDYECVLWKINGENKGCFDQSSYDIDHITEHAVTHNDEEHNLQALCKLCHSVKTKQFLMKWNLSDFNKLNIIEVQCVFVKINNILKCKKYLNKMLKHCDLTLAFSNSKYKLVQVYTYTPDQINAIDYVKLTEQRIFDDPIIIKRSTICTIRNYQTHQNNIFSPFIWNQGDVSKKRKILTNMQPQPLPNFIYDEIIRLYKINDSIDSNKLEIDEILDNIFEDKAIDNACLANLFMLCYPDGYFYDVPSETWISINNYGIYSWENTMLLGAKKLLSTVVVNRITQYFISKIQNLQDDELITKTKVYDNLQKYIANDKNKDMIIAEIKQLSCPEEISLESMMIMDHIYEDSYPTNYSIHNICYNGLQ